MNIRKLSDLDLKALSAKRVFVRMDFDVPKDDFTRIEASLPTLKYLLENSARLFLIGHRGRPGGIRDDKLSLKPLTELLKKYLNTGVSFVSDFDNTDSVKEGKVFLFENLRFYRGEEENSTEFAKKLTNFGDMYVNEAFATSHRMHASFAALPETLPSYAGFRLASEIEHLGSVLESPKRPLVFLISGIKEDKIDMIKKIKIFADKVLVGGKLPFYVDNMENGEAFRQDPRLVIANLDPSLFDITAESVQKFVEEINNAHTIVLAGVMGKYEDPKYIKATKSVFTAIAFSKAYKIAGGGDTEACLTDFGLTDKFDWISVGGGAMLNFLAGEKLPGIEVLKEN